MERCAHLVHARLSVYAATPTVLAPAPVRHRVHNTLAYCLQAAPNSQACSDAV